MVWGCWKGPGRRNQIEKKQMQSEHARAGAGGRGARRPCRAKRSSKKTHEAACRRETRDDVLADTPTHPAMFSGVQVQSHSATFTPSSDLSTRE